MQIYGTSDHPNSWVYSKLTNDIQTNDPEHGKVCLVTGGPEQVDPEMLGLLSINSRLREHFLGE